MVDYAADFDISKLWRDRDVYGKPQTIARALTAGERSVVERRCQDLKIGVAPFTPAERDDAVEAMSRMLGGIRSLRHDEDENAVAGLDGLRHVLAAFPLWAIEAGCHSIHCGEAIFDGKKMDKRWAPNDSQVYGVIKDIVKPYQQALDNVERLLAAPVQQEGR